VYRIGFLGAGTRAAWGPGIEALQLGLRDHGYVDGRDITIEYRWAENRFDRLPELALELVRLNPDVIITHGTPCTLALKRATSAIPIVMSIIGNPVENGVVSSLAQPGGNITGSSFFSDEVTAKRLEILKTGHPHLVRVGFLTNPQNVAGRGTTQAMEAMAQALNVRLQLLGVRTPDELHGALTAAKAQTDGVVMADDQVITSGSSPGRIADFAVKSRLPSIGPPHTPRWVGYWATGLPGLTSCGGRWSSWTRFSRAPSRPTCPSSRPPSLS
jgi:putative ABC transport system substrate-binding protein